MSTRPRINKGVTLKQVKESKSDRIFYSTRTVWWTDDPNDLQGMGIPMDVFGAVLFEAPKDKWLEAALSKPDHYGKYGLEILMASHHKNFTANGEPSSSFTNFQKLNEVWENMEELKGFTLLE